MHAWPKGKTCAMFQQGAFGTAVDRMEQCMKSRQKVYMLSASMQVPRMYACGPTTQLRMAVSKVQVWQYPHCEQGWLMCNMGSAK